MRSERKKWLGLFAIATAVLTVVVVYWWKSRPHVIEELLLSDYVRDVEILVDGRPIQSKEEWGMDQGLEVRFMKGPRFPELGDLHASVFFVPDGVLGNKRAHFVSTPLFETFPQNQRPKVTSLPKPSLLPSGYTGYQFVGFWGSAGLSEVTQIHSGEYALVVSIEDVKASNETRKSFPVHQVRVHLNRVSR